MTYVGEERRFERVRFFGLHFCLYERLLHFLPLGDGHRSADKAQRFSVRVALIHGCAHFYPFILLRGGKPLSAYPIFLAHFLRFAIGEALEGVPHAFAVFIADFRETGGGGHDNQVAVMCHLLFGDVQVVADVAREEAGLQIPFPRGHVGSVEGSGQLMVGGFQHLLRQHQFGIVHTKDIDAAFRFGMYGDDGQMSFRLLQIILKGYLPVVIQFAVPVGQFRRIIRIEFAVFLSQYFFFGQDVFLESGIHFPVDIVDNPATGVEYELDTGIEDRHVFDQTAIAPHDLQPPAPLMQRPLEPYHIDDGQCHQREKQGQIIFVPLEKSGGLHTKNSVVGTQAEQQSALYVVGIIDDGRGRPHRCRFHSVRMRRSVQAAFDHREQMFLYFTVCPKIAADQQERHHFLRFFPALRADPAPVGHEDLFAHIRDNGRHQFHVLGTYVNRAVLDAKLFIDRGHKVIAPQTVFGIGIDD